MNSTEGVIEVEDLEKNLTLFVAIFGGVIIGLVGLVIIMAIVICVKVSSLKKQLDLNLISLKSTQGDISQINAAVERFPKNIVQFPMTKSTMDDDDKAGTEPASPLFYRKGFTPTPLASSLLSVAEVPSEMQMSHNSKIPLQRSNAMFPVRAKQPGPPVPPKRAQSFNTHSFNY